jgi:hypothetical protein
MFARVASFEGGDEAKLAAVNQEAMDSGTMSLPDGLSRAMVLGANADGKRLFVTFFEDRAALDAAEQRFESMGDEIPEEVRGRRTSVDVYEVLFEQGG